MRDEELFVAVHRYRVIRTHHIVCALAGVNNLFVVGMDGLSRDHTLDPADDSLLRDVYRGVQLHHKGALHGERLGVGALLFHRLPLS